MINASMLAGFLLCASAATVAVAQVPGPPPANQPTPPAAEPAENGKAKAQIPAPTAPVDIAPGKPDDAPSPKIPADAVPVPIGYLQVDVKRPLPLSRFDLPPKGEGIQGAEIALRDNNTTGQFTKQRFILDVESVPVDGDAVAGAKKLVESGHHFILVDAPAKTLLLVADAMKGQDVLLFNVRATDVDLREENCRANVLHTAPDRYMLADALAQYLIWKKWPRWFLVTGVFPEDKAYADAIRRAAKRFGGKIVSEKEYNEAGGARRSDSGQTLVQRQMPIFTQGASAYDVMIVADESEVFGPYMPFRTWDPRPVAGTSGLSAASWHPAHEQWGATQMQNRFERFAKRFMLPLDYQAWVAVRTVGEGATRSKSADFGPINDYIHGPKFGLAAFKGQVVSYRSWDGQLRQPIILGEYKLPVSVSPQEGFLHPRAAVDTLGIDEPETKCKLN